MIQLAGVESGAAEGHIKSCKRSFAKIEVSQSRRGSLLGLVGALVEPSLHDCETSKSLRRFISFSGHISVTRTSGHAPPPPVLAVESRGRNAKTTAELVQTAAWSAGAGLVVSLQCCSAVLQ